MRGLPLQSVPVVSHPVALSETLSLILYLATSDETNREEKVVKIRKVNQDSTGPSMTPVKVREEC